jgi:hypothetical protein
VTRSIARRVARGLVGVMLFAQMAIAAYACPGLTSAMAGDVPRGDAGVAAATVQMAPCDDMAGAMDPTSANLCAEHCKLGQQSDHAPTLNVPAAVLTALYATPLVPEMAPPPRPATATMSALVAASPPHTILHCVFRI